MNACFWIIASFVARTYWFKNRDHIRWLGTINTIGTANEPFGVRFLKNHRSVKIMLLTELCRNDQSAELFSWCLQYPGSSRIVHGVRHHGGGLCSMEDFLEFMYHPVSGAAIVMTI